MNRRYLAGEWPAGTMRAAAIISPNVATVLTVPVPQSIPGEVLVAPQRVGLCGTDLELLHGTAHYLRDGRAGYPHIFGHEWVGHVVAVPADESAYTEKRIGVGDRVVGHTMISCGGCRACHRGRRNECGCLREVGLYGQQGAAAQYVRMPMHALSVVPDELTDTAAMLAEPAVTALEGLERVRCAPGDRVLVVGTGTIGLLSIQFAVRMSGTVDAVGVEANGFAAAQSLGARRAFRPGEAPGGHYDVVVEASGADAAIREASRACGVGGRVAMIGVPSGEVSGMHFGDLVLRGISVHGIRHGIDQYDRVLQLLKSGLLTADGMVSDVLPLERIGEAFKRLADGNRIAPKVALAPYGE